MTFKLHLSFSRPHWLITNLNMECISVALRNIDKCITWSSLNKLLICWRSQVSKLYFNRLSGLKCWSYYSQCFHLYDRMHCATRQYKETLVQWRVARRRSRGPNLLFHYRKWRMNILWTTQKPCASFCRWPCADCSIGLKPFQILLHWYRKHLHIKHSAWLY